MLITRKKSINQAIRIKIILVIEQKKLNKHITFVISNILFLTEIFNLN